MTSIKVTFRDGTFKDFPHQGRAGGSYTKSVRYEGVWCIVTDEWGNETAYPADLVQEVQTRGGR